MNIATKTKPALHLNKNDKLVLTDAASGKQKVFSVQGVEINEENDLLPVRVHVHTPELYDEKATAVIGHTWRENVEVVC